MLMKCDYYGWSIIVFSNLKIHKTDRLNLIQMPFSVGFGNSVTALKHHRNCDSRA